MSDFKAGGIPTPDYDSEDVNYIYQKTEFTEDVFVYGKLYADLGGDVQTFSTAGVERVRITKEGNVGIGENSPDALLHLSTGASTTCEIRLTANNTGSGSGDRGRINVYSSRNDGTAYQAGYVDIDRSSGTEDKAHLLVALNNGSGVGERLRITSTGQVVFKPMTQTERDALTAQTGGVIYNSTTNKLQCWNGSSWNNLF